LTIQIDYEALEKACKAIIETILICVPNAFKGTVYRIGRPPELIATRITSGIIDEATGSISWGLPEASDYNPPGKPFAAYRDEPGRALEAMAWCVERQQSWTAEDPRNDARSVRLQVEGIWSDFHHMEPVLIRKKDLYLGSEDQVVNARNYRGEPLWEDSEYVVAAVIKIHFRPHTIRIGGPETKIIKTLSRSLGTELLSYQLRHQSLEAMERLAEDRLNSCNILADSLRNVITKYGLIFSLIKLELGFLREQWEAIVLEKSDKREMRRDAVRGLNEAAQRLSDADKAALSDLTNMQNRFLTIHLPPEQGEKWVRMQIEDRWNLLIRNGVVDEKSAALIREKIGDLKKSLYLGMSPDVLAAFNRIPQHVKTEWVRLLYASSDGVDLDLVGQLVHTLDSGYFDLPFKEKSIKSLTRLKAVAEIIGQMEEKTNVVLREVLNGHHQDEIPSLALRKVAS